MGDKSKLKIGTYQNPNSGRSKESIDRYVKGMREKKYGGKRINTDRIRKFNTGMTPGVRKKGRAYQVSVENLKEDKERLGPEKFKKLMDENKMKKKGMLTGGQAKIAAKAPPPNKIDAKDFAVLRAEKAKGRGMGLQDEKVQPGKVMKARVGKSVQGTTAASANKNTFRGYQKVFDTGADRSTPKAERGVSTIVGVKPNSAIGRRKKKRVTYKSMDEMRQKTLGYKKGESTEAFKARKANETFAKNAAKATGGRGKAALAVATAGVAAYQYLKSKMNKKKDVKKKMGGGMMQKYVEGGPAEKSPMAEQARRMGQRKLKPRALDRAQQRRAGPAAERFGKRLKRAVGLGALGAAGKSKGKEDSSVTLGKFMKARVDSINKTVKAGGMGADRVLSKMRRPEKARENIESGKFKQTKDAAYYKSIGLTGKRGDAAVKDFFKPESVRLKNLSKNMQLFTRMGGGMMNKPMGYKSGKSIKVKCKLGKNKPTKMY